ncbi:hypothetical protein BAY61_12245 [Prauserella marina]|uniref:Uncharacterized protein n=1 Tax=Prauserella marina TaxID=530584 RepID=A0A222VNZ9_9PSEU|nr:zinc metallochaperone AztD [Prauserella marina]ASR35640.1 hypothetical protein BAY61_12245 [Prauserella marina]PWV84492.1 hypothetical protein DES30_101509 [Prauserella marina]SDC21110.1 hypothetical protein SAMN05421630_101827 [Prauserella marina]
MGNLLRSAGVVSAVTATVAVVAACGPGERDDAPPEGAGAAGGSAQVADPVVVSYDGGIYVLEGTSLDVAEDIKLEGFNRLNPAGDDRHVMVSTSDGFVALDAVGARLTDIEFPGAEPGHVVPHAGTTTLFADGTGEVTVFDPARLAEGKPEAENYTTAEPHHGVALRLSGGELVVTLGNEQDRVGMMVLGEDRTTELARNEDCPGVHGEATAQGEAVVVGCEDGVLVYRDGDISKVDSPDEYGRIGNQAGSEVSPVVLGDYKRDELAELERPEQVSLIDTVDGTMELVDLGTSYTFRSLARGPEGEALVLGTDGAIHVIDPESATVERTIPVLGQWEEPLEWQQPRPALFVRGNTAYVTDPAEKTVAAVDLASGEKVATATLDEAPNELSGVAGH